MGQGTCKFGAKSLCSTHEIILTTKSEEIPSPDLSTYEEIVSRFEKETLASGVFYQGEKNIDNERHGIGKLIWPNNSYYIGNFKKNVCCGHGYLILNEEESMEGEWSNDQLNGKGSITKKEFIFTGEFHNDLPHGKGEIIYTFGGRYGGEFCFGLKQGHGKLVLADFTYEGHFDHDMMNGYGECSWNDGKKYKGNWVKNKMEGRGIFLWPDGKTYDGEYEGGLKHGVGSLMDSKGEIIYKGYWMKGERYEEN